MDTKQNAHPFSNHFSFHQLPEYVRVCLISTFLWGLAAHAMALTNKFAVADEVHFGFTVGSTVVSGRWFLGILGGIIRWLFGSPNFSLPLTGGLLTILLTALCSCAFVSWMNLKRKVTWILVSGLMIVFPVMSGLFFYSFTAPYYMFSLLLSFLGCTLLCKHRSIGAFIGGITLVTLSISVYQAFLPMFLSLLLVYFIQEVNRAEVWDLKTLLREILWYSGSCILMICLYFLSVKLSTVLIHQELLPYKGISSMGSAGLADYLQRVKLAIYLFLFPTRCDRYSFIFPYRLVDCYYGMLALLGILGTINVIREISRNRIKALSLALAFGLFPLASNFIYVMCAQEDIYTLMQFGLLAPFLLLACLSDWQLFGFRINQINRKVITALLCVFCLFCVRMDNAVYTKGIFVQTRAQSYFTTMISRIKSTPGYTGSTPVAYVGDALHYMDASFHRIDGFGALTMAPLPYDATPFCVGYSWEGFLNLWCGFCPPTADPKSFEALPEVEAMPCYPDAGSIRMVNGVVVVKFSGTERTDYEKVSIQ